DVHVTWVCIRLAGDQQDVVERQGFMIVAQVHGQPPAATSGVLPYSRKAVPPPQAGCPLAVDHEMVISDLRLRSQGKQRALRCQTGRRAARGLLRPAVAPSGLPTAVGALCPPRKRGPRAVA